MQWGTCYMQWEMFPTTYNMQWGTIIFFSTAYPHNIYPQHRMDSIHWVYTVGNMIICSGGHMQWGTVYMMWGTFHRHMLYMQWVYVVRIYIRDHGDMQWEICSGYMQYAWVYIVWVTTYMLWGTSHRHMLYMQWVYVVGIYIRDHGDIQWLYVVGICSTHGYIQCG